MLLPLGRTNPCNTQARGRGPGGSWLGLCCHLAAHRNVPCPHAAERRVWAGRTVCAFQVLGPVDQLMAEGQTIKGVLVALKPPFWGSLFDLNPHYMSSWASTVSSLSWRGRAHAAVLGPAEDTGGRGENEGLPC